LYSKGAERPRLSELRSYYDELIAEFFPEKIDW
jgi:inositol oxygenase